MFGVCMMWLWVQVIPEFFTAIPFLLLRLHPPRRFLVHPLLCPHPPHRFLIHPRLCPHPRRFLVYPLLLLNPDELVDLFQRRPPGFGYESVSTSRNISHQKNLQIICPDRTWCTTGCRLASTYKSQKLTVCRVSCHYLWPSLIVKDM